jgi:hypothetical protein
MKELDYIQSLIDHGVQKGAYNMKQVVDAVNVLSLIKTTIDEGQKAVKDLEAANKKLVKLEKVKPAKLNG